MMLASSLRSLGHCCQARTSLLFVLLLVAACNDTRSPLLPTDPDTVARQVVAQFMSLPVADVALVSLEAQDFNDSSLDCPEPGMAYQQVITPGFRAIVEAEGRRFSVRVAGGHARICHNSKRGKPATESAQKSDVSVMINAARNDLANRIDVAPAKIRALDVRPTDQHNLPIGCTPHCAEPVESCGYMIGLFHDGRRYDYHATDGTAVPCPSMLPM